MVTRIREKLLISLAVLLLGCSGRPDSNVKEINSTFKTSNDTASYHKGVLVVDMLTLKQENGLVTFYDSTKRTSVVLNSKTIIIGRDTCNYYESSCGLCKKGCLAFDLEYDLFVIANVIKKNGNYCFKINGQQFYVSTNRYLRFESYKEHLKRYSITLVEESPLRESPSVNAKEVEGFINYEYKAIEFRGDWVRLDVEEEYKRNISGWAKWINGDSLLIAPVYIF